MLSFATIMLLAGIGIPVMAAMTSSLGKHLSSPVAASAFAFFMAFCIALLALMISDKSFVKQIPSAPKYLFVAGAFIAFYVLSISFVAPQFGIGNEKSWRKHAARNSITGAISWVKKDF